MDGSEILKKFDREADGAWVCRVAVAIETEQGAITIEPGQLFHYGETVGGIDVAEMLERLGAQFGS